MHFFTCLHDLPGLLMFLCVLLCIFSYIFVVSIKNLDLDWPLSGWGYGHLSDYHVLLSSIKCSNHEGVP